VIRPGIKKLFRLAFHRREDAARDVRDEIRLHVELRIEQLIAGGMAPVEARREAERKFGSVDHVQPRLEQIAAHRETAMRTREWRESFTTDLRYVLRSLRRSPTFVISATLTMALGLGANLSLFSLLDRLYLQAPPGISSPDHVRRLYATFKDNHRELRTRAVLSAPEWTSIASAIEPNQLIAGYRTSPDEPLGREDDAPKGVVTWVLGDYFGTLGVHLAAGRTFTADEIRSGGFSPLAVVTSELARRRFGSERDAIGKSFDHGAHNYTIIGVAPAAFRGADLDATDVWLPMNTWVSWVGRDTSWLKEKFTAMIYTVVRSPTAVPGPALVVRATSAIRAATMLRDTASVTVDLGSINEMLAPGYYGSERMIATRLAVVAFAILLIACANVANLLLARAMQRRREIGMRLALGVSRARLVRQLLTESIVLAVLGSIAAIIAAVWTATALRHALLPDVQWGAPAIGWRAVVFAIGSATVAGAVAGAVPALYASRPNLGSILTGGTRDGARHRSVLRSTLLASQIALSCVLLAGASLFVRSLKQVEAIDIGYDEDRLVFAGLNYSRESSHTEAEVATLLTDAAPRIEKLPGVERIAHSMNAPMWGFSMTDTFMANGDTLPRLDGSGAGISFVSPTYFASTGMRMLSGRAFSDDDQLGSEPVMIVNATFAATVWPGVPAIGKCIVLDKPGEPCRRVVGVVSNTHRISVVEPPSMQYYVPLTQKGFGGKPTNPGYVVIRAAEGRAAAVAGSVQRLLSQIAPTGVKPIVRIFSEQLQPQLRPWRLGAALFTAAGLLALLVAGVGIYGTIAYTFSQRTQEIGVRIALGAQGSSIIALVLKSSVVVALIGVVIGTGVSIWAGRFAKPLLYDTAPNNPFVLGGVALVLLAVAVIASLVPAMRAKRIDPLEALRAE
jgi:predicted permease